MDLSREQIESYGENGYLVVPGLASEEDVEELRRDTLRICRGVYPHEKLQPMDGSLSDDEVLRNFLCIHHPHKVSPVICARGVRHTGIADVLAGLIGPDVKCMQSMLFVKPPEFQGQAWHQDEIYIPTRDRPGRRDGGKRLSVGAAGDAPGRALRPASPRQSGRVRLCTRIVRF